MMAITTDLFKESSSLRVKVAILEKELEDVKTEKSNMQKSLEKSHAANKSLRTEIADMKTQHAEVDEKIEALKQAVRQEKSEHDKTMTELWEALDTVNKANKALRTEKALREEAEEKVEKWEQSARLEKVDHERTRGEVRSINDSLLKEMKVRFGELSDKLGMSATSTVDQTVDQDQSSAMKTAETEDIDVVKSQIAALTGKISDMTASGEKQDQAMTELAKTFDDVLKKVNVASASEETVEPKQTKKKSGVGSWLKRKLTSKSERGDETKKRAPQNSTQQDVSSAQ